jgi:hypothetical protein
LLDCVEDGPHAGDHAPYGFGVGVRGGLQGSAAGGALQCPEHLLRLRGERFDRACVMPGLIAGVPGEVGADLLGSLGRVEAAGREDADRAAEQRCGDLDSVGLRDVQ